MADSELSRLYDSLSRFHWLLRRLSRKQPGEGLEMRKRLLGPGQQSGRPGAGCAELDRWLFDQLGPRERSTVLDVGCGFGATLFRWQARHSGRAVGLTISPYQLQKARAEAEKLGCAGSINFRLQSYDEPIDGNFDCIVSIESLAHSPDLKLTLQQLCGKLLPGGVLGLVEDVVAEGDSDADDPLVQRLLDLWASESAYSEQDFRSALEAGGLTVTGSQELSDQVPHRDEAEIERSEHRLRRWRTCLPTTGLRRVADAFLGGLLQERLYARGRLRYLALVAERPVESE